MKRQVKLRRIHWVGLTAVFVGGFLACSDPVGGGDKGGENGYPVEEHATCKKQYTEAVINRGGEAIHLVCKKVRGGRLRWERIK